MVVLNVSLGGETLVAVDVVVLVVTVDADEA